MWVADKQQGQGRTIYLNGDVHEGSYYQGEREGLGILTRANGNVYQGSFHEG
jgi:hypothetical protein